MPRYDVTLTTLEAVARQLNVVDPETKTLPQFILDAANSRYSDYTRYVTVLCNQVSKYIMQETDRSFVPYLDDRIYYHRDLMDDDSIRYGRMGLEEDLLVPSSVTWEGGGLTTQIVDPTNYRFLPTNVLPSDRLLFDVYTVPLFAPYDFNASTVISATWGYHTNLSQAYTVMQTSITIANDTTTSITVTLDTAVNYETFQYLKIDNELMQIAHIDLDTDVLTVLRGVNGTTAAAHPSKALYRFNIIEDIALAATRLAAYLWIKRVDVGTLIQYADGTVVISNLPEAVKETLYRYSRKVWGVATGFP